MPIELFAPWRGSSIAPTISAAHDDLLSQTSTLLKGETPTPGAISRALVNWADLCLGDTALLTCDRRLRALGIVAERSWLPETIVGIICAPLLSRAITSVQSLPVEIAGIASAIAEIGVHGNAAAVRLADLVTAIVSDTEQLATLRLDQTRKLVQECELAAASLTVATPRAASSLRSAVAMSVIAYAGSRTNADDYAGAEAVLSTLADTLLGEADRREVESRLRTVRFNKGWADAVRHSRGEAWSWAIKALELALANAPDEQEAAKVRNATAQLMERQRREGAHPASKGTIPWRLIVSLGIGAIILVSVIANSLNGGDNGSQNPSPGLGADSAGSSGPPRVVLPPTPKAVSLDSQIGPNITTASAALDRVNAFPVTRYDEAVATAGFAAAAQSASDAAGDLRTAAASATVTSAEASCREAIVSYAQTQQGYWSLLARAARLADIDQWNTAVDLQPVLNSQTAAARTRCATF